MIFVSYGAEVGVGFLRGTREESKHPRIAGFLDAEGQSTINS